MKILIYRYSILYLFLFWRPAEQEQEERSWQQEKEQERRSGQDPQLPHKPSPYFQEQPQPQRSRTFVKTNSVKLIIGSFWDYLKQLEHANVSLKGVFCCYIKLSCAKNGQIFPAM
jgi:hypothetical protein